MSRFSPLAIRYSRPSRTSRQSATLVRVEIPDIPSSRFSMTVVPLWNTYRFTRFSTAARTWVFSPSPASKSTDRSIAATAAGRLWGRAAGAAFFCAMARRICWVVSSGMVISANIFFTWSFILPPP